MSQKEYNLYNILIWTGPQLDAVKQIRWFGRALAFWLQNGAYNLYVLMLFIFFVFPLFYCKENDFTSASSGDKATAITIITKEL